MYILELTIASAVYHASSPLSPYLKRPRHAHNTVKRYFKRLIRKINKGAYEATVWDKIKARLKKNKKVN